MSALKFSKMHGLGNDFMVIDGVSQSFIPQKEQIALWANRRLGIGFDQLLLVEKPTLPECDFRYRIFNADGGEVEQCGNGARCFFRFVHEQQLSDKNTLTVQTQRGIITLSQDEHQHISVNMGQPRFAPEDIPFLPNSPSEADALNHIAVIGTNSFTFSCVNVGNPHAVVVVDNVDDTPVAAWGTALQQSRQFPEQVNVGFMQIVDDTHIRLRVFERGVGETPACGTGACAAAVAGMRMHLLQENVTVSLPGGDLQISWSPNQPIVMTGPAVTVYHGVLPHE